MSSDFYTPPGIPPTRSHLPFRSTLAGIPPDAVSGKRSLAEFQQQQQQQQEHNLGLYLRNVKQRMYHQASSMSHLSTEYSNTSSSMNPRYGVPVLSSMSSNNFKNLNNFVVNQYAPSNVLFRNSGVSLGVPTSSTSLPFQESETKMMNRLQELEKALLDDNDDGDEEVSGVINSEWSETYQNLMVNPTDKKQQQQQQHLVSLSPTSSTSSCSSTSASPITCPKTLVIDAASAISEGKSDAVAEFLTRLSQVANVNGTPEQRLVSYMVSALRSRVNSKEFPAKVSELYSQDHTISTHNLYDISASFKLGFMAANLAILEATTMVDKLLTKLHVVDFDVGQGRQYVHLLHALAGKKDNRFSVWKITAVTDYFSRGEEARLRVVGDMLKTLGNKIGISLIFNVMSLKINELSREKIGSEEDEALAVNLAFKLYKLPDESVTTENLRDELLRRVKRLSPMVVTVVEQEMNCNTSPFVARVNEVFSYYSALFESLDAAASRESPDRARLEEGLGRKMANSVACEGSDRVERCEVFGKWRARMGMAGFGARPISPLVADSLRSKLSSVTLGNGGFTLSEQSGGICFGWMGRSLTVASAWH